ncbi:MULTISPECIES: efflux transporter outer membrane subunit [unclassified Sphingomonas]|uniref:efflux transporter outer membrane subunit n=1 Tax=unclassified Sphingomonas TaxID=196159 RepID=UPI0028651E02|nr:MULTISPECIES: efflux transporter outer membrane subunit [unclassified Sphingomonas]MDR6116386.1 NodT family efflux transporter outer membrane factor (OMF) lipoprotein [Sphingomonas sp. SORGH_AS_0789]MDR6149939.1 NodT family efflux transporter outer membrane factor (OMF) lipoprotein [Sphingomonas sp. SORGH_AS_0742]
MKRSAFLTALLLAGCSVPQAHPAVAPVAPDTLGLGTAQAPLVATEWWHGLGDPQLDRIVGDALSGNPSLEIAMARLRQAESVLASRRAEDGPAVSLDAQEQYSRISGRYTIPPPYAGTTQWLGQAQASLNWTIDLFGRQAAAIQAARASTRAAMLDVTAARLALAGSVAQTYVELARAERQAAIARRTIDTRTRSLGLVQARIRNHLASQLDASSAQTLLAQARVALARAEAQAALARNALAALAGRGLDYPATIAPTRIALDTALPMPGIVPADLLSRRPDIAAALARIEAAKGGQEVARKAFLPNVNLMALAGFQAVGLGNLFTADAGTVGAGPAIHLPIFDSGRLRAGLAGATAALDLATADYNDRVVGAVREAADAVTRSRTLATERARQSEVTRGLAETRRLNAIRVSSGLQSQLGLIDPDIRQLEADQADANLAADAVQARIALAVALGGGFSPSTESTPR